MTFLRPPPSSIAPSSLFRAPSTTTSLKALLSPSTCPYHHPRHACQTQVRHATLLPRPKRPYTFTQLVTLSDGSTYTHRTSSPIAVYKSSKDLRNNALWNPSSQKLLNVEADEAGRLKAFRRRFGRGWDARRASGEDGGLEGSAEEVKVEVKEAVVGEEIRDKAPPAGERGGEGEEGTEKVVRTQEVREVVPEEEYSEDNLLDLISGYGAKEREGKGVGSMVGEAARQVIKDARAKGKKGKKG